MTTVIYIIVTVGFLTALFCFLWKYLRAYVRFHGKMLVTCPETGKPVGVETDAKYTALTTIFSDQGLRLRDCTRWPEREDCGQECLSQIETSPENCLVRCILANWFRGKVCALCRRTFDEIHWHDHKPALLNREGVTVEWHEIPVETLPQVLKTHRPVCWNCHIAETFRRRHPDLVIDRPWKQQHQRVA